MSGRVPMLGGRLAWSILKKPLLNAVVVFGLLMLRLVFGPDPMILYVMCAVLLVAVLVRFLFFNTGADRSQRRRFMEQALAEPVWMYVVREVLSGLVLILGTAFVLRAEMSAAEVWNIGSDAAYVFLLGAPLFAAAFMALAYSRRRSAAKWFASEAGADEREVGSTKESSRPGLTRPPSVAVTNDGDSDPGWPGQARP